MYSLVATTIGYRIAEVVVAECQTCQLAAFTWQEGIDHNGRFYGINWSALVVQDHPAGNLENFSHDVQAIRASIFHQWQRRVDGGSAIEWIGAEHHHIGIYNWAVVLLKWALYNWCSKVTNLDVLLEVQDAVWVTLVGDAPGTANHIATCTNRIHDYIAVSCVQVAISVVQVVGTEGTHHEWITRYLWVWVAIGVQLDFIELLTFEDVVAQWLTYVIEGRFADDDQLAAVVDRRVNMVNGELTNNGICGTLSTSNQTILDDYLVDFGTSFGLLRSAEVFHTFGYIEDVSDVTT